MEEAKAALTELQFTILDGMADDYEDVEQLYIYANKQWHEERQRGVQFPKVLLHVRFPLREVMDEVKNMLQDGYIEVKYSNDEELAPIPAPNFSVLHHYWFGATEKGHRAWEAHRNR